MALARSELGYHPSTNGHSGSFTALQERDPYLDQQRDRGRRNLLEDMFLAPAELPWLLSSAVW